MSFVWGMVGLVVFALASMVGGACADGTFFGMLTGAVLGVICAWHNRLRDELAQMRVLLDRSLARCTATPPPPSEPVPLETLAA